MGSSASKKMIFSDVTDDRLLFERFLKACFSGDLEIAKSSFRCRYLTNNPDEAFISACRYGGCLELAKWILENSPSPEDLLHAKNEEPFRWACAEGHLEVAKWIVDISRNTNHPCNIHHNNDITFSLACRCGHLEVAKWIFDISPRNTLLFNSTAEFKWICYNDHFDLAKWIFEISKNTDDPCNIHIDDDMPFREACKHGNLEFAKWIIQIDRKCNIRAKNDEAFRFACLFASTTEKILEIAQWLCTLCANYSISISIDNKCSWAIK